MPAVSATADVRNWDSLLQAAWTRSRVAAPRLRYVLSMFALAHQALMMALSPGPVGVR